MWENDEFDVLNEMGRGMDYVLERMFSGMESSLYDPESKSLRPLYRIEATDSEVIVTFDLPCVEKEDISLTSTEDVLSIEAKMRKPVSLRVGAPLQKHVQFDRYSKKIRLPVKVDPNKANARFSDGFLTIRFPIVHRGTSVKIE